MDEHMQGHAGTSGRRRHTGNDMNESLSTDERHNEPTLYQIRIVGHLDEGWSDNFGRLTITHEENGETLLTGPVADQAALHGLLRKIRDLGMPLTSVERLQDRPAGDTDGGSHDKPHHSTKESQP
jgi:hypothetical protein